MWPPIWHSLPDTVSAELRQFPILVTAAGLATTQRGPFFDIGQLLLSRHVFSSAGLARGTAMQEHEDLVRLALICVKRSRQTSDPEVAIQLMQLAREYQRRIAEMDAGKLPNVGEN
jgi:hypothetical protein